MYKLIGVLIADFLKQIRYEKFHTLRVNKNCQLHNFFSSIILNNILYLSNKVKKKSPIGLFFLTLLREKSTFTIIDIGECFFALYLIFLVHMIMKNERLFSDE